MTDSRVEIAAFNNAAWCDAVCDALSSPGEFLEDVWVNRHPAPPFYPNVVTLTSGARSAAQVAQIQALLDGGLRGQWAVKDSFAALDLVPLGFQVAFDAAWLWRRPGQPGWLPEEDEEITGVRWRVIQSPDELRRWEAAWGGTPEGAPVFHPDLMEQPGIAFIAAYQGQEIVAGVVASRTEDVVGISNIFVPADRAESFWRGCVRAVEALFPGLPMVDYERGPDLEQALHLGFENIGALRVWTRRG
jgi:hypothetical protein